MSYLPAIINGSAFLMFLSVNSTARSDDELVELMSIGLMSATSYGAVKNLASRFVSKALSKNPYYEAICFFGCCVAYYGMAKIFQMLRELARGDIDILGEEAMCYEQMRESIWDMERDIRIIDAGFDSRVRTAFFKTNEAKMEMAKKIVGFFSLNAPVILIEYLELKSEFKALGKKDVQDIDYSDKFQAVETKISRIKEKLQVLPAGVENRVKFLINTVKALFSADSIIIDSKTATLAECHAAIWKIFDKLHYREELYYQVQNRIIKLKHMIDTNIIEEEPSTESQPNARVATTEEIQNLKSELDLFEDMEEVRRALIVTELEYIGFLKGIGQMNNVAFYDKPDFTGLRNDKTKVFFMRRTAGFVTKLDCKFIKMETIANGLSRSSPNQTYQAVSNQTAGSRRNSDVDILDLN